MTDAVDLLLAALGGGGIAIAVVLYYLLFHPEKAEKLAAMIAAAISRGWRRADRTAVGLKVASDINAGRAKLLQNTPEGLLDRRLKIKWAKTSDEAKSILSDGEVLVVMQHSSHHHENVANALMAYLPRALLPHTRRHLDRRRMHAADLVVAKSLLAADQSTEGALSAFFEDHLDPAKRADPELERTLGEMDDIDLQGWLMRVLLVEYRVLGEAALNIRTDTPDGCRDDAEEFARWLHQLATRDPGSEDVSLRYDGRYFKVAVIFVAIRERYEDEGLRPYRRRAKRYIYRERYDAVYLMARDWSIQAVEALADELESDALIARVDRYRYPLRSDFSRRTGMARSEAIVTCLRRKHGDADLVPPAEWDAFDGDDDLTEETYRPPIGSARAAL